MTAEVHRLTEAGPIIKPIPEIIDLLRELLAQAEKGEIKGVIVGYVEGSDAVTTDWCSGCAGSSFMLAAASRLFYAVLSADAGNKVPLTL